MQRYWNIVHRSPQYKPKNILLQSSVNMGLCACRARKFLRSEIFLSYNLNNTSITQILFVWWRLDDPSKNYWRFRNKPKVRTLPWITVLWEGLRSFLWCDGESHLFLSKSLLVIFTPCIHPTLWLKSSWQHQWLSYPFPNNLFVIIETYRTLILYYLLILHILVFISPFQMSWKIVVQ